VAEDLVGFAAQRCGVGKRRAVGDGERDAVGRARRPVADDFDVLSLCISNV